MNRVTLIGHLTADPEMRELRDGTLTAILSVATRESWSDESGKPHNHTERSRIVVQDASLTALAQTLHKGSRVQIEGSLQTRNWVDHQNIERYSPEVVLLPGIGNLIPHGTGPLPVTKRKRTRGSTPQP